jgi:hypothetical protein
MPVSRNGRAWFSMLVALLALLAFAPQAGATEYEDELDEPVACAAHEDRCSEEDPETDEPVSGCVAGDYEDEDACSDDDEVGEPKPDADEESESGDDKDVRACEDGPIADSARGSDDGAQLEDGCLPQFVRRFISRVWKFVGEVDYYEEGVLSMTLGKILNLPRKWRTQDDELLDQDTTVLVSERVRVFQDGERVGRGALDEANDARVHGKLLRPFNWHADEDGSPVPTIRAKKVYITG